MHEAEEESKNWFLEQVGRQRPLERTGRSAGQAEHWLKDAPEHEAQSGWQETQVPEDEKELDGHDTTHWPFDAS